MHPRDYEVGRAPAFASVPEGDGRAQNIYGGLRASRGPQNAADESFNLRESRDNFINQFKSMRKSGGQNFQQSGNIDNANVDIRALNNNSGTLSGADLGHQYNQPSSSFSPPSRRDRPHEQDNYMAAAEAMEIARRPVSPKYERQNHNVRLQSAHLRE